MPMPRPGPGGRLTSPLDDDDHLSEILRRLPPRPSSLPRASLVCKHWRDLAASPHFLRDFRIFHRAAPPLLGFFHNTNLGAPDRRFVAAADPPDHTAGTEADNVCSLGLSMDNMWHYEDPQGGLQGPFSMLTLRHWSIGGFFREDFRVWRTDETKEQAVLLTDAMQSVFSSLTLPLEQRE